MKRRGFRAALCLVSLVSWLAAPAILAAPAPPKCFGVAATKVGQGDGDDIRGGPLDDCNGGSRPKPDPDSADPDDCGDCESKIECD